MSSSYRLSRRINSGAWNFGSDPSTHYVIPWGICAAGDTAMEIDHPGGVKVCFKNRAQPKDSLLENAKEGKKVNGLYKSYNLYYPDREFQTRTEYGSPWPEGGQNRQELLLKDYIRTPIRYNGTGLENMRQISGQEFAYGWEVVNKPPQIVQQNLPWKPQNFDLTRLNSNPSGGDLRNQLYNKYPHPEKTDFYHVNEVKAVYPNNLEYPYRFLPGSVLTHNS